MAKAFARRPGEEGFSEPQQQCERSARGLEWPAVRGHQTTLPGSGVEARGVKMESLGQFW